jgi:hypothetical protein
LLCAKSSSYYSFFESLCAFDWSTENKYSAEGLEPLVGYDGLFGMFLKRVKTTFVPRRPGSRLSNRLSHEILRYDFGLSHIATRYVVLY